MKKKRYKKLVKKINNLKKLVESNNQQSVISVWPPIWQPDPGQWEVTYTETLTDPDPILFAPTHN